MCNIVLLYSISVTAGGEARRSSCGDPRVIRDLLAHHFAAIGLLNLLYISFLIGMQHFAPAPLKVTMVCYYAPSVKPRRLRSNCTCRYTHGVFRVGESIARQLCKVATTWDGLELRTTRGHFMTPSDDARQGWRSPVTVTP